MDNHGPSKVLSNTPISQKRSKLFANLLTQIKEQIPHNYIKTFQGNCLVILLQKYLVKIKTIDMMRANQIIIIHILLQLMKITYIVFEIALNKDKN